VIEHHERVYGPERTETATVYNNISSLYIELKEIRLARKFAEKSYQINLKVFGPKHSLTILDRNNLAQILEMERDPELVKANVSDSRLCSACNKVSFSVIDSSISSCSKVGLSTMLMCSGCIVARYCCAECQLEDWKEHKTNASK
jgi:hypothetical protein